MPTWSWDLGSSIGTGIDGNEGSNWWTRQWNCPPSKSLGERFKQEKTCIWRELMTSKYIIYSFEMSFCVEAIAVQLLLP